MGEAKRKRDQNANEPCPCGSLKEAGGCCYNGRVWYKRPAVLGLRALSPKSTVDKCYMKELRSCDGGISGEHLVSESVLHILKADGDFSISGVPWLPEGEAKIVGPRSLTAKCLCSRHNSALAPLDDAAKFFFSALKLCLELDVESQRYLVSGYDLERWLLKTIKALAVSGNLARGQKPLPGLFASDIQILDMLDNRQKWPAGAGLYSIMLPGQITHNHNRFQIAPYMNARDELNGLGVNIMGLDFVLMLEPPDLALIPHLQGAHFRPTQILIEAGSSVNWIAISWEEGSRRKDTMSLNFLRTVKA